MSLLSEDTSLLSLSLKATRPVLASSPAAFSMDERFPPELIAYILDKMPCDYQLEVCAQVCTAFRNAVADIRRLSPKRRPVASFSQWAAEEGYVDLLDWAVAQGCQPPGPIRIGLHKGPRRNRALMAAKQAAGAGDLPRVQSLFGPACDAFDYTGIKAVAASAAAGGHLNVLCWLYKRCKIRRDEQTKQMLAIEAAPGGHVKVLEWADDRFGLDRSDTWIFCRAAEGGHMALLHWLYANNFSWNAETCEFAAKEGRYDILKWLIANGCPVDNTSVCSWIATNGDLDVLQWARANGCDWCASTMLQAAAGGHLKILQWAHANGCPRPESGQLFFLYAAESGSLEVAQWVRAQGYAWDARCLNTAAIRQHWDIVEWALANGCPPGKELWFRVANCGRKGILALANDLKCTWKTAKVCAGAASGGHLELLQWMRAGGCPWDEETCAYAAFRGHLRVLKWARAHGCPWNTKTFIAAAKEGRFAVMRWLRANKCPERPEDIV